jgi:hypothetical protein
MQEWTPPRMILSGTFCMSACGSDSMFYNQRVRIAAKAKSLHLPTIFPVREHVEAGGLISYGVLPPNSARVESGRHAHRTTDQVRRHQLDHCQDTRQVILQ